MSAHPDSGEVELLEEKQEERVDEDQASPGETGSGEPDEDPAAVEPEDAQGAGSPDSGPEKPAPPRIGPGEKASDAEIARRISAVLFASPDPLSLARLTELLERPAVDRVRAALEAVPKLLKKARLPLELREIAGGWQLLTTPDVHEVVSRLVRVRKEEKVSPAALETLAVVAYRQPVTKAEVEAIRGVQVGPILRALVDRGLARVTGRADVPGHPLLYGTTRKFLSTFGLAGLKDLPRDSELVRD